MVRTKNWWLLFVTLAVCGCRNDSVDPQLQISCWGPVAFSFYATPGRLFVNSNLFALSDPSQPKKYFDYTRGYYIRDTAFSINSIDFGITNNTVYFDTIGSLGDGYDVGTQLSGYPSHVAVKDSIIYIVRHVAFSSGSFCSLPGDTINALDVNILVDTSKPARRSAHINLGDPQDIAINGSTLYVLDATRGLLIYSLSDPLHPALVTTLSNITGYHMDLTPQQTLIVHSVTGLTQYDVSNPTSPVLLGKIQ